MSRAEQCIEQMEADGIAPNLYTYNAMVKGWAMSADSTGKAGRADAKKRWTRSGGGGSPAAVPKRRGEMASSMVRAEAVLLAMKRAGITPSHATYNSMIRGYAHRTELSEADRIFKELRRSTATPSVRSYNAIMSACVYPPSLFVTRIPLRLTNATASTSRASRTYPLLLPGALTHACAAIISTPLSRPPRRFLMAKPHTQANEERAMELFVDELESGIRPDRFQWEKVLNRLTERFVAVQCAKCVLSSARAVIAR